MSKWHNVSVSFTVELGREVDGDRVLQWEDLTYSKLLPDVVLAELETLVPKDCEGLELDFDVRSSGYYDPGKTWGLPENCYPPEGKDEREVKGVYLLLDGKKNIPLSKASADLLEALYQEEINDAELPSYEGGGDY